MIQTVPFQ